MHEVDYAVGWLGLLVELYLAFIGFLVVMVAVVILGNSVVVYFKYEKPRIEREKTMTEYWSYARGCPKGERLTLIEWKEKRNHPGRISCPPTP